MPDSQCPRTRHGMASEPRRRKLAWALWGKGRRTEQVERFEKLVQDLHDLVPPDAGQGTRVIHTPDATRIDTRVLGTDLRADTTSSQA
jgi:hypothetical protein